MIGQPFNPDQCVFISAQSLNANQFNPNVPDSGNATPHNLLWNFTENKLQWVNTLTNIIVAELGGGGDTTKYFRAQLTSVQAPLPVEMTILENTISDTVSLTNPSPGVYNLTFGTEKFAEPLKVDKTQFPQNGTFGGLFIQTLGGDILGASVVRYFRTSDTNVQLTTFVIGTPSADGLLDNHSLIIVRVDN